nr:hypothetical protein [Tanacetum cinerariifolium]
NQSNHSAGVQEQFDVEKAGEERVQQYVLFLVWSSGSINPQNTDGDAAFEVKEPEFEGRKPQSKVNVSLSSSAQSKKHDDKTKREAKGKSPIESSIGCRNLSAEFEDFSNNNINEDNVAVSPELKDITYSDNEDNVGAEADFKNLKTSITNTDADVAFDVKDNESEVHVSSSSNLRDEFEEFSINNTNRVNATNAPVTTVGPNPTNITNSFNADSPSDNAVSPNFKIGGKSPFVDPSQYPDDLDMSALEDIEPESEVHVSPSSSAKTKKHDDKTQREAKGKSPVE